VNWHFLAGFGIGVLFFILDRLLRRKKIYNQAWSSGYESGRNDALGIAREPRGHKSPEV